MPHAVVIRHGDLMLAYLASDFKKFCKLIDEGADINCPDVFGDPLIDAVIQNFDKIPDNKKFFDKLLSSGASLKGGHYGYDALTLSILRQDDIYYMKKILDAGANINIKGYAIDNDHVVRYGPPIFESLIKFNSSKIKLLLEYNPDLTLCNIEGNTILISLFEVFKYRNDILSECLPFFIEKGAPLEDSNDCGSRLIHYWANYSGDPDILKLLIKNKIDINIRDFAGFTPLMTCIKRFKTAGTLALIENGANLDIKNFDGQTAAMIAANFHSFDILNLIKSKCNIYTLDNAGKNIGYYVFNSPLWNHDGCDIEGSAKFFNNNPKLFSSKNKDNLDLIKALKNYDEKKFLRFMNLTRKQNHL